MGLSPHPAKGHFVRRLSNEPSNLSKWRMNFMMPSRLEKQNYFTVKVVIVGNRTIHFLHAAPPLQGSNSTNTLLISWVTASLRRALPWQPQLAQAADPAGVHASENVLQSRGEMHIVGMWQMMSGPALPLFLHSTAVSSVCTGGSVLLLLSGENFTQSNIHHSTRLTTHHCEDDSRIMDPKNSTCR